MSVAEFVGSLEWRMWLIILIVSYADLMVVAALKFLVTLLKDEAVGRLEGIDPAFLRLLDASKPWLERDDH